MKRASEAELGVALRTLDDLEPYVYRLPDPKTGAGVSNWKPCDFMVWWKPPIANPHPLAPKAGTAWFEAKDTDAANSFPKADFRPSQVNGILVASRLEIPYFLCVYWRRARRWSISDARRVLDWFADNEAATSIPRMLLMSRFGIDSAPADLGQTLKIALTGEL